MRLQTIMADAEIPQADIARHLGLSRSAVSLKMSGARRWSLEEVVSLKRFFGDRQIHVALDDLLPDELGKDAGKVSHAT